ncbi:MAG: LytTR family transcriptional regulator [Lachnospiraceae bacterium]|nr:LytTR family transcriptional regulator [Lachnospiraceae bacterium]
MKVRVEITVLEEDEEILIRTREPDVWLLEQIGRLAKEREMLTGYYSDGSISRISPSDIFYFESVENHVFAYGVKEVLELKCRLYELEERLSGTDFVRVTKSMILNLSKVERFVPVLGGRIEAVLNNGERAVISRQYVPEVKRRLGLYAKNKLEKNA